MSRERISKSSFNVLGTKSVSGRKFATVHRKRFPLARLVFLYHKGYFPENEVDHINQDFTDDRIENLREVSRQCNLRNSKRFSNNKSGVKGVCYDNSRKKWLSSIKVDGIQNHLGRYIDFIDAVFARYSAEICLNWNNCCTNSSSYLYLMKQKLIRST